MVQMSWPIGQPLIVRSSKFPPIFCSVNQCLQKRVTSNVEAGSAFDIPSANSDHTEAAGAFTSLALEIVGALSGKSEGSVVVPQFG